ncbi:MAG: hypothetical protein K0B08_00250 [Bacteroidales bacterium]|nr:hypothetical protein [Bacteroidales bacterium]
MLVLVIVVFFSYVQLSWKRTFDAPYPDIVASDDPVLIERGKYLAYGPAHCAVLKAEGYTREAPCHGDVFPAWMRLT